jgi:dynein heavy chain
MRDLMRIMELAQLNLMTAFKEQLQDLVKLYVEAKENIKFLSTLERHFKNISRGSLRFALGIGRGCGAPLSTADLAPRALVLSVILETIPPMMNSLRMIWIISRHYSKDDRMGPLMKLIAQEITSQVGKHLNIRTMFRRKPRDVMKTIKLGADTHAPPGLLRTGCERVLSVAIRFHRQGCARAVALDVSGSAGAH